MARATGRRSLRSTGNCRGGDAHVKHIATTFIGALTLHAISPAAIAAAPAADLRSEVVRFADLDVARPAAAQELYRRIRKPARTVCAAYGPVGYDRSCVGQAIARAVADVDAPHDPNFTRPLPRPNRPSPSACPASSVCRP